MQSNIVLSESEIAGQLTTQYRAVVAATGQMLREAVRFGAMLMELENLIGKSHAGRGSEGEGIKAWLAEHCPEINYNSAKVYKSLAVKANVLVGGQGMLGYAALQGAEKLTRSNGQDVVIPGEIIEKRDALFEECDSRRKLEQAYCAYMNAGEMKAARAKARAERPVHQKMSPRQEAEVIWTQLMQALAKHTTKDVIPLLGLRAADVCYRRMKELTDALKARVDEGV